MILIVDVFHPGLADSHRAALARSIVNPVSNLLPHPTAHCSAATTSSAEHRCDGHMAEESAREQLQGQHAHAAVATSPQLKVEVLSEDPMLLRVDDFATNSEIAELLRLGTPLLQPSELQTTSVNQSPLDDHVEDASVGTILPRTSSTAYLKGDHATEPAVLAVLKRLSIFTGRAWTHSEGVQLVRYLAGEYFVSHTDYFKPGDRGIDIDAGQRLFTGLLYLNDDFGGGETRFGQLNITVIPTKGSLLFWRNINHSGEPDRRTAHQGLPVVDGVKFAANLWVLERPFKSYQQSNS